MFVKLEKRVCKYAYSQLLIALSAILFFQACRQQPEVSVKIERLEQSLFTIPIDSIPASIPRLEQQYRSEEHTSEL